MLFVGCLQFAWTGNNDQALSRKPWSITTQGTAAELCVRGAGSSSTFSATPWLDSECWIGVSASDTFELRRTLFDERTHAFAEIVTLQTSGHPVVGFD